MNIYVMRHGKTDWNSQRRTQGIVDIPLNDEGRKQAIEARDKIKDIVFDKVYSSPLSRAIETARLVTEDKYPIIIDDLLIERNFGEMEGKVIGEEYDVKEFLARPMDASYNGEETHKHMVERAEKFLSKIDKDNNILVVTHGAYYRAIMKAINKDISDKEFIELFLGNCEIQKIVLED